MNSKSNTRYLIHFSGTTMVFTVKACAELYGGMYNTQVVEVLVSNDT